jgi:hypothetical protein
MWGKQETIEQRKRFRKKIRGVEEIEVRSTTEKWVWEEEKDN